MDKVKTSDKKQIFNFFEQLDSRERRSKTVFFNTLKAFEALAGLGLVSYLVQASLTPNFVQSPNSNLLLIVVLLVILTLLLISSYIFLIIWSFKQIWKCLGCPESQLSQPKNVFRLVVILLTVCGTLILVYSNLLTSIIYQLSTILP